MACRQAALPLRRSTLAPASSQLSNTDAIKGGLYVSQFSSTSILAYKSNNKKNGKPICSVPGVLYLNGVAVDGKGNLIDPDAGSRSIIIFKGPGMCGAKAGSTRTLWTTGRCRKQRRAQRQDRRRQHVRQQ